jgi:hypothetical protein
MKREIMKESEAPKRKRCMGFEYSCWEKAAAHELLPRVSNDIRVLTLAVRDINLLHAVDVNNNEARPGTARTHATLLRLRGIQGLLRIRIVT